MLQPASRFVGSRRARAGGTPPSATRSISTPCEASQSCSSAVLPACRRPVGGCGCSSAARHSKSKPSSVLPSNFASAAGSAASVVTISTLSSEKWWSIALVPSRSDGKRRAAPGPSRTGASRYISSTSCIPVALTPALRSLHAAANAGLSNDASGTITATVGAPTSLLQTVCRLPRSASALPRFMDASIEPTRIGTFCVRHDSW
mmetsp:Transcript_45079/g.150489  ORF Transcript_45079/g.150489 Transcript_45079/m.150489 type:complete len:204 (+) Transcript_45079:166-777(+)